MKTIFIGPNGIRAGWRLLIFFAIVAVQIAVLGTIVHFAFPQAAQWARRHSQTLTPALSVLELFQLVVILIAAFIMSKIEKRRFSVYGLPRAAGTGRRFRHGAAGGFIAISGVMLAMFAFHGFRITGLATHGTALLIAIAAWALPFVVVGLSEEFAFRGYIQYTLTTGIGFWGAAVVTSLLFAAAHTSNFGESIMGVFEVALFAIVFCFVLLRTGNLWWGVGYHAAWDWGETFFYGVPDSGMKAWHPLFASSFSGPAWLTGGTVGPEGSVITCVALLLTAVYVAWRYPRATYSLAEPVTQQAV